MANEKSVNVAFSITGADASKVDIDKVKNALAETGPAGTQAAQTITQSFQNVENSANRVTNKISEGRYVTVRDAIAINQQFNLLKSTIEATFGSIQSAPADIQTAFAQAQQSVTATTQTVRDMSVQTKFLKQDVNEAGGQWLGFENAIARAFGEQGKYVAGFFLVVKAWEAGWAIGTKLNTLMGVDMTESAFQSSVAWQKAGAILKAFFDMSVEGVLALKAGLSGNFDEMKDHITRADEASNHFGQTVKEAVTASSEAYRKLHPTIKDAEEATKKLDEAQQKAKDSAEAWKQKEEELAQKIVETTKAIKDEQMALDAAKHSLEDADIGISNSTNNQGYYKRGLDSATTALEAQKTKVADLTRQFGEQDPQVTEAKNKQAELERQVNQSKQSYTEATTQLAAYEAQHRTATAAIETATTKIKDSNKELAAENKNLEGLIKGHDLEAEANRKATEKVIDATKAHVGAAAAVDAETKKLNDNVIALKAVESQTRLTIAALNDLTAAASAAAGATGPAAQVAGSGGTGSSDTSGGMGSSSIQ